MSRILIVPNDLLEQDPDHPLVLDPRAMTVRTAGDATEALQIAEQWHPELILFSSSLAGEMDPVAFCARFRQDPVLVDTRLVMLTDCIGPGLAPAYSAEADAHLVCPISQTQLQEILSTLLAEEGTNASQVPVQVLARLEGLSQDADSRATTIANTINLSETGMRVESKEHLIVGQHGTAHFYLPGSTDRLSLRCTVRLLLDEILLHYVVEFQDLDISAKEALATFVRQQAEAP